MPEDEEVDGQQQETNEGDAPELTYEEIGEDRYRWEDGLVTNAAGDEIEEEGETEGDPLPEIRAATPKPKPEPEKPKPAEASGRQIYTREATRDAIYTESTLQEIADVSLLDPVKAERMRAQLNETYNDRLRQLNRHANETFDRELDELAVDAPQTIERYTRQIMRRKQQLTEEQLQTPGMAKWVASQVVAEQLYADPLAMEEAVMRSTPKPTPTTEERKAVERTITRRVIPPAERTPGPGTARRTEPTRRADPQKGKKDALAEQYMRRYQHNPSFTWEEAVQLANAVREQDAQRLRQS